MKIITVSGAYSGVGKTRVVTKILKGLEDWSCLKVTVTRNGLCGRGRSCGVCNTLKGRFSVITDDRIISQKGKDTARFKDAGAKEVVWLQSTPGGLKEGLRETIAKFKKVKGLIIEGTSALKYIKPHLAIFITGRRGKWKPSARDAFKKADLILRV